MASEYKMLGEFDTKEFRKKMGFPLTRDLKYYSKIDGNWKVNDIVSYEIVGTYDSGSNSMLISLDDSTKVRIHSDYLAEMQKPSFVVNNKVQVGVKKNVDNCVGINREKVCKGKRIESTPRNYVVVDIETTGINHFVDDIIEIGAVRYIEGKEVDRFSTLIKSEKILSKKIVELTGITDELLQTSGIEKETAIRELYSYLKNDEIVLGHNFASFDFYFLDDAYNEVLGIPFCYDFVDTLYLAKEMLPGHCSCSLASLSQEYNIDYSCAHRAVEDCVINHFVYECIAFGDIPAEENSDSINENDNNVELVSLDKELLLGWKKKIQDALDELIDKHGLPQNSLRLMGNKGKNDEDYKSYSLCIFEPNIIDDGRTSKRNDTILNIRENTLKTDINILKIEPKKYDSLEVVTFPADAKVFTPQSGVYCQLSNDSSNLVPYIVDNVEYALDTYSSKTETFACCSKYEECSDSKKCVHRNLLFAKACQYRKNLEDGRIFYGMNKNI